MQLAGNALPFFGYRGFLFRRLIFHGSVESAAGKLQRMNRSGSRGKNQPSGHASTYSLVTLSNAQCEVCSQSTVLDRRENSITKK